MSSGLKPPDEVCCMDCGPGAILDADRRRARPALRLSSSEAKIIEFQQFRRVVARPHHTVVRHQQR